MPGRAHKIVVKRAYEPPVRGDGVRLLVDRLRPRGLPKDDAHFDQWRKDLAPSTELRTFYGHRPERFAEFTKRYRGELREPTTAAAVSDVIHMAQRRPITLLTATRDLEQSGAAVLAPRTYKTSSSSAPGPLQTRGPHETGRLSTSNR